MPTLEQSLQRCDPGHLEIIAEFWGIEVHATEEHASRKQLVQALLAYPLHAEVIESLPGEARSALQTLIEHNGQIPWGNFARQFGDIREMGAAKRDRDLPHLHPISAAEILYYHALLARAFFDNPTGPIEFAYIPEDLFAALQKINPPAAQTDLPAIGRAATPAERAFVIPNEHWIMDDATTLLAFMRMGLDASPDTHIPAAVIRDFLTAASIISDTTPQPDAVKSFLEAPRSEGLKQLKHAWINSQEFNELQQVPSLLCEGEWRNEPHTARAFILDLLRNVPLNKWWSLTAFLRDIKENFPDFLRPAREYDSWFIKRKSDGIYLRGFAHWDEVDGALIRYLLTGPMHWLGLVALASAQEDGEVSAFQVVSPGINDEETGNITALSHGRITIERNAPRAARYQIARFAEWLPMKAGRYQYLLTPASLERALQQGLKIEHLLSLLNKTTAANIPPSLTKALKNWDTHRTEARIQTHTILKVSKPEILTALRKSKAARFLEESYSPTVVVVKSGSQSKIMEALAELGYLTEEIVAQI